MAKCMKHPISYPKQTAPMPNNGDMIRMKGRMKAETTDQYVGQKKDVSMGKKK
jgi:hypothetical protein